MENRNLSNGGLLEEIYRKITIVETKIDSFQKIIDDHEERLRGHDKIIWVAIGFVALLQVIWNYLRAKL